MDHAPGFLALVESARPHVRETTADEFEHRRSAGEPVVLIDVREDREWEAGHIPGAVHIGRGVLERDIEALVPDSETPLVLVCGGGFRSVLAADSLGRMGYTNVESLAGGMRAWRAEGRATVTA